MRRRHQDSSRPWWRALRLWRIRSIRGRVTALVAVIAMLLLVPAGLLAGMLARQQLTEAGWADARYAAGAVAAADRVGRLVGPGIMTAYPSIDLIQIVDSDGRVLASTPEARGLPALSDVHPPASAPREDLKTCEHRDLGCLRLTALRVNSSPDSNVVYAAGTDRGGMSVAAFDLMFAIQVAVLISLAVGAAWKITGRTLKPVEAIRAELAATNLSDLSSRVPEPPGDDEIARLARTVNSTLTRLENARGRMEESLARQRRFASDASHELRTPVAGLRVRLEEARMHPEDADLPELVDRALGDVDRLQAIIADLLLLARIGGDAPGALKDVDLAETVHMEVSRRTDRLPVRLRLAPGVVVKAMDTQIARVLTNLLDNAQRHAKRVVVVEVRAVDGHAELIVCDDGDGVAVADRERIFDRFTRLDASRCRDKGGTGLGLAIVRDIAHAHGGTIEVGDAPEGGACFVLRIPLPAPEAPRLRVTGTALTLASSATR
ncbi:two-component sensor histidine kinase [Sphaerisporangium krabiense]|uniref:histidine kinase n=1 Tax=Sphaerisporangium krabiense TaxID=763782 RepID=A0A7W9DV47_9ACTN|nr:HAMP domain-containing sensor histidine kinase [Sphaerisporangium krabiense]MBB5631734.1 signal transduction histidine kinase [Sphaerisporangium krabiense]GII60628.1 two-component sensor histidine kinase [Sphaerisporangium krabiense]